MCVQKEDNIPTHFDFYLGRSRNDFLLLLLRLLRGPLKCSPKHCNFPSRVSKINEPLHPRVLVGNGVFETVAVFGSSWYLIDHGSFWLRLNLTIDMMVVEFVWIILPTKLWSV